MILRKRKNNLSLSMDLFRITLILPTVQKLATVPQPNRKTTKKRVSKGMVKSTSSVKWSQVNKLETQVRINRNST